jgi:tryptophan synthase beta chain
VAEAMRLAPTLDKTDVLLINLSGRGDKDLNTIMQATNH